LIFFAEYSQLSKNAVGALCGFPIALSIHPGVKPKDESVAGQFVSLGRLQCDAADGAITQVSGNAAWRPPGCIPILNRL
jgi:hypothetical protein